MKKETTIFLFRLFIALLAWLALGLQLYVMFTGGGPGKVTHTGLILLNFFSYFTILTNLMVALCFSALAIAPASRAGRFFSRPSTITAVTVYITIVGLVYSIALRAIWDPRGLQLVVDRILHDLVPIATVLYWVLYIPRRTLHWKQAFPWLLYPFLYLVLALARGVASHWFAYYFIDYTLLGWPRVILNVLLISAGFLLVSLLFIWLNRIMKRN